MVRSPLARFTTTIVAFVAIAVLALVARPSQAAMAEKGQLAGTVMTADGKPAVGLVINLIKDIPRQMNRPGGGSGTRGAGPESGAVDLQGKPAPRSKVIAKATCDEQGKFVMQNVDVGGYRLEAGNQNIGWIYQDVAIEPNKTLELNDLKLVKTN